jgi:tRNA modification GTPase|tara:strand:- start:761 stop:2053 length:1293 start_codon:yes stop_codon:yes gene_type:complete
LDQAIVACSTPPGRGAISVVRISGKEAKSIINNLFSLEFDHGTSKVAETNLSEGFNEKCLISCFEGPSSYTGEDVAEISCHGNPLIVRALIQKCIELGARNANPGEFTQRAFLNNKIDLAQSEAVIDLINASSSAAMVAASKSVSGNFGENVDKILESLRKVRILVESSIDFSDQDTNIDFMQINALFKDFRCLLEDFDEKIEEGIRIMSEHRVVVAGPPNVGKSSIMNILSGEEASIVTEIKGTTRDPIYKKIQIKDLQVDIYDTAGINDETVDEIEKLGIDKSRSLIEGADLILEVIDAENRDFSLKKNGNILKVFNKSDISSPPKEFEGIVVSALEKKNISALEEKIYELLSSGGSDALFSARERHRNLVKKAFMEIDSCPDPIDVKNVDIAAEHLKLADMFLGDIKSPMSADDFLGEIFSAFCIGK